MAQYRHRRVTGPRWQRIVAMIVTRDSGICHICGGPGATSADHVIALADGGNNFPTNLRAAHPHCNYAKNARRSSKLRDRTPHRSPRGESLCKHESSCFRRALDLKDTRLT